MDPILPSLFNLLGLDHDSRGVILSKMPAGELLKLAQTNKALQQEIFSVWPDVCANQFGFLNIPIPKSMREMRNTYQDYFIIKYKIPTDPTNQFNNGAEALWAALKESAKNDIDAFQYFCYLATHPSSEEKFQFYYQGDLFEDHLLHIAVESGNPEALLHVVELVRATGKSINLKKYPNLLPAAVAANNIEIVKIILADGISPNPKQIEDKTQIPFHIAAKQGNLEMLQLLIQYKANPKITNSQDEDALQAALESSSRVSNEVIQFLIQKVGVHPSKSRSTHLGTAIIFGYPKSVIKDLLDAGANPNQLSYNFVHYSTGLELETPLMLAASHSTQDVMELLVARGAHAHVKPGFITTRGGDDFNDQRILDLISEIEHDPQARILGSEIRNLYLANKHQPQVFLAKLSALPNDDQFKDLLPKRSRPFNWLLKLISRVTAIVGGDRELEWGERTKVQRNDWISKHNKLQSNSLFKEKLREVKHHVRDEVHKENKAARKKR